MSSFNKPKLQNIDYEKLVTSFETDLLKDRIKFSQVAQLIGIDFMLVIKSDYKFASLRLRQYSLDPEEHLRLIVGEVYPDEGKLLFENETASKPELKIEELEMSDIGCLTLLKSIESNKRLSLNRDLISQLVRQTELNYCSKYISKKEMQRVSIMKSIQFNRGKIADLIGSTYKTYQHERIHNCMAVIQANIYKNLLNRNTIKQVEQKMEVEKGHNIINYFTNNFLEEIDYIYEELFKYTKSQTQLHGRDFININKISGYVNNLSQESFQRLIRRGEQNHYKADENYLDLKSRYTYVKNKIAKLSCF